MSGQRTFTVYVCPEPKCGLISLGRGACWNVTKHVDFHASPKPVPMRPFRAVLEAAA
jgi:hypothetical protein